MTSRAPGSSPTRPSASSSGSGTNMATTADTPRSRTTSESIAVRPGRCSCRCPMRRDTRSATLARPWWSSAARSVRPTASSSTCPTATATSSRPTRLRPPRPSWTGMYQRLPFWAECPRASSTTIPGWLLPGSGRRPTPAHPRLHRAAVSLPVRGPVRASRQGQ